MLGMLYKVTYIGTDIYVEEKYHITLYLPRVVNSSYLHVFFKGSCWQISFWQKLLRIWKSTYVFLSSFPPCLVSLLVNCLQPLLLEQVRACCLSPLLPQEAWGAALSMLLLFRSVWEWISLKMPKPKCGFFKTAAALGCLLLSEVSQ